MASLMASLMTSLMASLMTSDCTLSTTPIFGRSSSPSSPSPPSCSCSGVTSWAPAVSSPSSLA
jgi:hypothetical protein